MAAMNVAAYSTALGTDPENRHYQKQFSSFFELLVQMESVLLDEYQASVSMLNSAEE
jgi:hypothetical protein